MYLQVYKMLIKTFDLLLRLFLYLKEISDVFFNSMSNQEVIIN